MSDSDEDLAENNMFHNENTLLRGQGSVMNNRFNNSAYFTYNSLSTQLRNSCHRRETSPMSLQSAPAVLRQHSFYNPQYVQGRICQSPDSMGSKDSTSTVFSAAFVAQIFKNMKYNNHDRRIINEAYNKYFRNRARRKIGKRRKLKLFLKHNRRKSDDSGDEGSDSSVSSDDNKSVRSAIPKESILRQSNRSNRTEILNFRATVKKSNMYTDCTEHFKHSTLKNSFNGHNINHSIQEKTNIGTERKNDCNTKNISVQEKTNGFIGCQKESFTKGFMLPSQRFNKSTFKPITNRNIMPHIGGPLPNAKSDDSENEEIFPNQTIRENSTICRKRTLENHDAMFSDEKRNKFSSYNSNTSRDDVIFKKPQMPIKRQMKAKPNFLSEQIISKSSHPLINNIGQPSFLSQSLNQDRSNISHFNSKINGLVNIGNTVHKKTENNLRPVDTDRDKDDTFSNSNVKNTLSQQKSNPIEDTDKNCNKIISPIKSKTNKTSNIKNAKKKSSSLQEKENHIDITTEKVNAEKLISKSLQPLVGNVEINNAIPSHNQPQSRQVNIETGADVNTSEMSQSISIVSMKPSFMKRKLFTQNLDIAEDKNSSIDSLSTNSSQTRNYRFREKNKVRKLATSQSCLSRDVVGEDNILDLIHKIVPADQINITSASNQRTRKSNPENEDKWDVASVISMCDNSDVSDTFTDEDIFQVSKANNKNKNQKNNNSKRDVEKQKCEVVEKLQQEEAIDKIQYKPNVIKINCTTKRTVASRVRSFWDTDFESDVEDNVHTPLKTSTNNLGQIKETEATRYYENISKLKDVTLSSIRTRENNTCFKEFPSQAREAVINASTSTLTNDKNIQENSRIRPSRRTTKNVTTKNHTKSLNEKEKSNIKTQNGLKSIEANERKKVTTKNDPKVGKEINNNKIQNSIKSLKTKEYNKVTTKSGPKLSNKNDIKKPTTNTKPIQEEKKSETKTQRKQTNILKEAKISLHDISYSSICDKSILTRSLRLKCNQQLLHEVALNKTISTPKPKSTRKNTPKRTLPKIEIKSNNKQLTKATTKNTKTTPSRRAKNKNTEFSKLNESVMCTRYRSHNTSLRVKSE